MRYKFILVEPKVPENIGASARAIKTMGFDSLSLVNPCKDPEGRAQWLAHGSSDILDTALVFSNLKEAVDGIDLVIATTTRKRSLQKDSISIGKLNEFIASRTSTVSSVAIVFGNEESGLSNSDIKLCDIASSIPLSVDFPSLNLSQAVMLYAYEISSNKLYSKDPETSKVSSDSFSNVKGRINELLSVTALGDKPALSGRILERIPHASEKDVNLIHSVVGALLDHLKNLSEKE